jgi:hypothetical protein
MIGRGCTLALLAALGVSLVPAQAGAALPGSAAGASVSVSPAITELQGTPPMALPATTVRNTTSRPVRVHAYPVLVRQAIDGGLVPRLAATRRAEAGRLLRISPPTFTLAPGASATVGETWLRRSPGAPGVWAAVAIDAVPAVAHPRFRLRLLQAMLLTTVQASNPLGTIARIDAAARPNAGATFAIRVSNRAHIHTWVSAATLLLRRHGRKVALLHSLTPLVVLPHAQRDIGLSGAHRIAVGSYQATATIHVGTRTTHRSFTVTVKAQK